MKTAMWSVWVLATVFEALLLLSVRRHAWPMLWWFLAGDIIRTIPLMLVSAVVIPHSWDAYVSLWVWTDPVVLALMVCAAMEMHSRILQRHVSAATHACVVGCLGLLFASVFLLFPDHDRALNPVFWSRVIADFVVAGGMVATMFVLEFYPVYAIVMTAFAWFDLVGYLTLILGSRSLMVDVFLIAFQALCFVMWYRYRQEFSDDLQFIV